jgi:hypothetical protein
MGAYSAAGVLGGTGAVVALAFGGPVWAVVWLGLVLVGGSATFAYRGHRPDRRRQLGGGAICRGEATREPIHGDGGHPRERFDSDDRAQQPR